MPLEYSPRMKIHQTIGDGRVIISLGVVAVLVQVAKAAREVRRLYEGVFRTCSGYARVLVMDWLGCIAFRVFLRLSYEIHTHLWNGRAWLRWVGPSWWSASLGVKSINSHFHPQSLHIYCEGCAVDFRTSPDLFFTDLLALSPSLSFQTPTSASLSSYFSFVNIPALILSQLRNVAATKYTHITRIRIILCSDGIEWNWCFIYIYMSFALSICCSLGQYNFTFSCFW